MSESAPIFTIDLEDWNHALHTAKNGHTSVDAAHFLFNILDEYNLRAQVYCLGRFMDEYPELEKRIWNHAPGTHGYYHDHDEYGNDSDDGPYRSPYWDFTPMPSPPSGGFFFRALPFDYVKWAVQKSGVFWIHPHDLDEDHPQLSNPILNWKRHVGLKTACAKLDRLLSEVPFRNA